MADRTFDRWFRPAARLILDDMNSRTTLVGWDRLQLPERIAPRRDCATAHLAADSTQLAFCGTELLVLTPQLAWWDIPNVHRCRDCTRVRLAA